MLIDAIFYCKLNGKNNKKVTLKGLFKQISQGWSIDIKPPGIVAKSVFNDMLYV